MGQEKVNLEIVKAFAAAAIRATKEQCLTAIEVGAPGYRGNAFPCDVGVASFIDLRCATFTGTLGLCYPRATFLGMVRSMTGESRQIIDASVRDGAAELLNIIFGQVKSTLNAAGADLPMAIPQVLLADAALEKLLAQEPAVVIPFQSAHGPFFAQIGLPAVKAEAAPAASLGKLIEGSFPAGTRILVVDDMATMRRVVKRSLQGMGYSDITEAQDGKQAWELIGQASSTNRAFQLVISDWNMPHLSGIELLKKVRSIPVTRGTPFVLLTAESELKQIMLGAEAGVSAYVLKPFTAEALAAKLREVYQKLHPAAASPAVA